MLLPYVTTCMYCHGDIISYHKHRGTTCECERTSINGELVSFTEEDGYILEFKVERLGCSKPEQKVKYDDAIELKSNTTKI